MFGCNVYLGYSVSVFDSIEFQSHAPLFVSKVQILTKQDFHFTCQYGFDLKFLFLITLSWEFALLIFLFKCWNTDIEIENFFFSPTENSIKALNFIKKIVSVILKKEKKKKSFNIKSREFKVIKILVFQSSFSFLSLLRYLQKISWLFRGF